MDWQLPDICKPITNNMLVRSVPLDTQCRAPRKHFSWTSPGPMAFEKNPFYKFSSYKDFTSKQTLILVSPLSF